jgi:hypothetical protein
MNRKAMRNVHLGVEGMRLATGVSVGAVDASTLVVILVKDRGGLGRLGLLARHDNQRLLHLHVQLLLVLLTQLVLLLLLLLLHLMQLELLELLELQLLNLAEEARVVDAAVPQGLHFLAHGALEVARAQRHYVLRVPVLFVLLKSSRVPALSPLSSDSAFLLLAPRIVYELLPTRRPSLNLINPSNPTSITLSLIPTTNLIDSSFIYELSPLTDTFTAFENAKVR